MRKFTHKNLKFLTLASLLFLSEKCIPFKESPLDPNSAVSSLFYLSRISIAINSGLLNRVATPVFSLEPRLYTSPQNVGITTITPGADVRFTLDGSMPSGSSEIFPNTMHIWKLAGDNVQAIGTKEDLMNSEVLSGRFSYPPLRTGQDICWDQNGNPVACGIGQGVGQDGALQNGIERSYSGPSPHPDFPNDYTTTDNSTGILWKSCPEGMTGIGCSGTALSSTWQGAINICNSLNSQNSGSGYAGRQDWRLPTRMELESLLFYGNVLSNQPRINQSAFPNTPGLGLSEF